MTLKRDNQDALDVLAGALTQCQEDGLTGALRILGNPGALFRFRDGVVVAVESPGSPGVDTVLIHSGRISAEEWEAALCEDLQDRVAQPAIVARGAIGEAELREVVVTAMWDAAFAAAAGEIDGHVIDDEPNELPRLVLPSDQGVSMNDVLAETKSRLDALASLPLPVSPYRERVVPARDPVPDTDVVLRQEIIAQANGRRSARDIAFAIGRGVHPVTVEISRMLGEGVVKMGPPMSATITSYSDIDSLYRRMELDRCQGDAGEPPGPLTPREPGRAIRSIDRHPGTSE